MTPPLPYRMHLRVALLECIAPTRINAEIPGDLVGRGRVLLEPDGDATPATIGWTFEMMQTPMRVAARVAPPLLRWGHDGVVDVTVATFRRHLDGNAAHLAFAGDEKRRSERDGAPRERTERVPTARAVHDRRSTPGLHRGPLGLKPDRHAREPVPTPSSAPSLRTERA